MSDDVASSGAQEGNLKPHPEANLRQVFKVESQGLSYRYVEEVTSAEGTSFTQRLFLDGEDRGNTTTNYQVLSGNAHMTSMTSGGTTDFFRGDGLRRWFEVGELPLVQEVETFQLESGSIFFSEVVTRRQTHRWLGPGTFDLNGEELSMNIIEEEVEVIDSSGNTLTQWTKVDWVNDDRGTLRTEYTEGNDEGLVVTLEEHQPDHASLFVETASSLQKQEQSLIMDTEAVATGVDNVQLREIYELGLLRSEIPEGSQLRASFLQSLHLYHQHYLYPDQLPVLIDEDMDIDEYVDLLQEQDPFTFYVDPDRYGAVSDSNAGERATIGIRLELSDGSTLTTSTVITETRRLKIEEVISLSRAYQDGLMAQDIIVSIDGEALEGMTLGEVQDRLVREEEEAITFGLERDGVERSITTAGEDHMASLLQGDTLYLNIRTYSNITEQSVLEDIEEVREQGDFDKVILDLRGNSGGRLSACAFLTDHLADPDVLGDLPMWTIPQRELEYLYDANPSSSMGVYGSSNVVILVDGDSASAAEITAGALQFHGEATVVGERTFGKGVGQTVFELVDGGGLWVTALELLLGGEVNYHNVGIEPDATVVGSPSLDSDPALEAALSFLNGNPLPSKARFFKGLSEPKVDPMFRRWVLDSQLY